MNYLIVDLKELQLKWMLGYKNLLWWCWWGGRRISTPFKLRYTPTYFLMLINSVWEYIDIFIFTILLNLMFFGALH